jgi:hypothetical protein
MDWSIGIIKAENGYICEWYEELDDGHLVKKQHVIEELDCEYCDLQAMRDLLYFVKERFGLYHSKHNRFNLYVEIKDEEQEQVVDSIE